MSVSKLISTLGRNVPFRITKGQLDTMVNAADEGQKATINRLKSAYQLDEQGDLITFRPQDSSVGDDVVKGATESQTDINLGGVPGAQSDIGIELNTSSNVAATIAPDILLDDLKKYQEVRGIVSATIADSRWSHISDTPDWAGKRLASGFRRFWDSPQRGAGELSDDIVKTATLNKYDEDLLTKTYGNQYRKIIGDLDKDELGEYRTILAAHDEVQKPYNVTKIGFNLDGKVIPASKRVVDSVLATRELLDHAHRMKNLSAVRQEIGNGSKLFEDKLVRKSSAKIGSKVDGQVFTNDLRKRGWRVFEEEEGGLVKKRLLSPEDQHKLKEIPLEYNLLPYRQGYSPVMYTQPWRVVKLAKGADGKVNAVPYATARSKHSAEQAVRSLTDNPEEKGVFFAHRSVKDELDIAMDEDSLKFLGNLGNEDALRLRDALKSMGFDDKEFNGLQGFGKFFSHKKDSTMMRRGRRLYDSDKLVKGEKAYAEILPSEQAIARHLQGTARYAAHAEWFNRLEKAFIKEFGAFLQTRNDWSSPINLSLKAVNGRTAREAYYVQAQLKRAQGQLSYFDETLDSFVTNTIDSIGRTKVGKALDTMLGNMATRYGFNLPQLKVSKGAAMTKGFTAKVKLGLMNLSQIPVQGTAFLNVVGYSGVHSIGAVSDLMTVIVPNILKIGRSSKAGGLAKMLDDSGFIAGFDYVGLQGVSTGKTTMMGSKTMRKIADNHMLPYTMGEGGVRALAWLAENRRLTSLIKSGKSTFKEADIGSPAYLKAVSASAMEPALNMSRMNQPLVARGLLGMPLQFQQFAIQEISFMTSKNLSPLQRTRVMGAWAGGFGFVGIPFSQDMMWALEAGYAKTTGNIQAVGWFERTINDIIDEGLDLAYYGKDVPQSVRDFWRRFSKGGVLPALTENDWTIAHRAGLGRYVHELFDNSSIDDMLFGPGYHTMKQLISNNVSNISELIAIARSDEQMSANLALGMVTKSTKGLTSITNTAQVIETIVNGGDIRTIDGKLVTQDATFSQLMSVGMGFGLGQRQALFETKTELRRRSKLIQDIMWGYGKTIAKLSIERPEYAMEVLNEKVIQIAQYNPTLLRGFGSVVSRSIISTKVPEEQRELILAINRYSQYLTVSELEMFSLKE